ncbi:MAG: TolC family protein [Odoribacter sp.]|nr:TolC family protein [Odoribacter sp.]
MKKQIYTFMLCCLSLPIWAQSGIDNVLKNIESNNKTLKASQQLNESQKLEAKVGNYLPNPTVELNQLWTDKNTGNNVNEFAVVQSFDFPTVYFNKKKLTKTKANASDYLYATTRQQILLKAQLVCHEIIYLRQQQHLLNNRQKNAALLAALYKQRYDNGDANQLEYNKIVLEKINADNASRRNQAALKAQLEQLQALNGGVEINFSDTRFSNLPTLPAFAELENEYINNDPNLKNLSTTAESAQQSIKVSRSLSLPKFDIGYRHNGGSGEKMNGFRIGMSIPLWENRNTVKQAKAQAEYTAFNFEDNKQIVKATLQDLYLQAEALYVSCSEYAQTLSLQRNENILNKALEAGQISMIEYFVEIALLYDSIQNYLDVEKEYHNIVAQLMQYKL